MKIVGMSGLDRLDASKYKLLAYDPSISNPSPTIITKIIPSPQIAVMKTSLFVGNMATLSGIKLDGSINIFPSGSYISILISNNSGNTWYSYENNEFITVPFTEDSFINKAIKANDFNNIEISKFANLFFSNNLEINFAFYFVMKDIQDNLHIDGITFSYDSRSPWISANQGVDYTYEYTEDKLIVRIYKAGNYKINYYQHPNYFFDSKIRWDEFNV